MESIVQKEKECYECGSDRNLHLHHLICGTANRQKSDDYGLTIWLCAKHHKEIHEDGFKNLMSKRLGQIVFEKTHSREEFIKAFGKSFLEDWT